MSTNRLLTLEQFIVDRQDAVRGSTGAFSRLIRDISIAAKVVQRDVRRAGLVDILGSSGETNVQGEIQQKLDRLAHEEFVKALERGGECCMIGSEEHAEAIPIRPSNGEKAGRYIVLMDPLDGSANIDVNVSIGTIFSIFRLPDGVEHPELEHALQPGVNQIAAGYILYGSSVMLVYTTGSGVNGFTLDPSIGEFILSHPNMRVPDLGKIYSINEGNYHSWPLGLKKYIKWVQEEAPDGTRPYTSRYIGSFVADFHRNLIKGGVYIYPADTRSPSGKLRLMYEANPMAFLIEQAGGRATDGHRRILEIKPQTLHQRTPIYIGTEGMVRDVEESIRVWGNLH
ncbi:MAG: class 1 fructose-bisphosphatase [Rhodothermia bacterium]|nr:class 1 fructose-bisphosphatase [Rhodothermia bacterium]